MIELVDMTTFAAVMKAGSFTDAATMLGVSKSLVSRRVGDLEKKLGVSLLDRSSRSVRPTEIGEVYFAECVRIVESVEHANAFAKGFRRQMIGKMHVVIPEAISVDPLSAGVIDFVTKNPGIVLDMTVMTSGCSGVDRYRGKEFDLFFHIGDVPDSSYVARWVTAIGFGLYANSGYAVKHGGMDRVGELCGRACSVGTFSENGIIDVVDLEGSGVGVPVRPRLCSDSVRQLLSAAEQGSGIVWAPCTLAMDLVSKGQLVEVLPDLFRLEKDLWALYPRHHRASDKVAAMINVVKSSLEYSRSEKTSQPRGDTTAISSHDMKLISPIS